MFKKLKVNVVRINAKATVTVKKAAIVKNRVIADRIAAVKKIVTAKMTASVKMIANAKTTAVAKSKRKVKINAAILATNNYIKAAFGRFFYSNIIRNVNLYVQKNYPGG